MDREKLEHFKKLLLEKREKILQSVKEMKQGLEDRGEKLADAVDQAARERDLSFNIRLKEREQKLLKKIDKALKKIEEGTYGICEACGREIDEKRLEARPEATLCIECKRAQERFEKIAGD